jgi:hypothetical protein
MPVFAGDNGAVVDDNRDDNIGHHKRTPATIQHPLTLC